MLLDVKHVALTTLLMAITWAGVVNARESRDTRFPDDTKAITYQPLTPTAASPSSSPLSSSSLTPEESPRTAVATTDDGWFSWANWRNILLHGGESQAGEARTFGLKRRIQMAIIPLVFKFGILSTMIFILVGLGLKTVFLLKTLLILNLAGLIAKLFIWKSEITGGKNQVAYSVIPAFPHAPSFAPSHGPVQHGKEVHLHIHNAHGTETWESPSHNVEPYGSYSSQSSSYVHPSQRKSSGKIPMTYSAQQF